MQTTNLIKIILLLPALVVLSPSGSGAGDQDVVVREEQSGQQIRLKVGQTFQVELPGLGGTGYSWYLDNPDSRYLELVSQETREASPERMVGGPILHLWRFNAKAAGQTQIKMAYYRQWEGLQTAARHFLLNIDIHQNGS